MSISAEPVLSVPRPQRRRIRQALAWGVHLYTASGLIAAATAAVLIVRGDPQSMCMAFVMLFVAVVIDATDGTMARAVRVKEVLPGFDGGRLDDIVDFLTYTALPLLLIWRAGILPPGSEPWLIVPLIASAYGFCQVNAKTADGYFVGFPSYWNLVAFYLYVCHTGVAPLPGWLSLGVVLGFALLTFVPLRYLYPSAKRRRINHVTNALGVVWGGLLVWILARMPAQDDDRLLPWLLLASLVFPVYYLVASWIISWQLFRRRAARSPAA